MSWAWSFSADAMVGVAFGVLAYHAAGAKGVAFLVAAQMLPAAALAPLFAAVTHRIPRERLLLAVDTTRALVVAAAALLAAADAPNAALLALAAVAMTATATSNPARRALVPLLVQTPAQLTAAGVFASVVQAAGLTFGPILAALLYLTGHAWIVLAGAAALLLSAVVADAGLPGTADVAIRPRQSRPSRGLLEGLAAVRSSAQLKLAAGMFAAKNLARGALNVLVVVVPLQLLGLHASAVGWLGATIGVGGVIGGLVATRLVGRSRMAGPMAVGLAAWGAPLLALGLKPGIPMALAGLAVLGGGNTVTDVAGYTLIARSARDDLLTRVLGFHEGLRALAITVGAAATALVVGLADARLALAIVGVALGAVAAAAALRGPVELPPRIGADDFRLLRASPLFRWLPPVALERVAFTLSEVELPAGEILLRQGEPGDLAYLVVDGELVVDRDGREIGRVHPGGVVGEIALLRGAPRMATVRALGPSRLLAIEREEFLAAATGGAAALEAAEELVETRLALAGGAVPTTVRDASG